ncbi:MAG: polyprenyltransferase, partial [Oscillatoria sp. PMC 1076.18]|nr:polyprenyltransferase [Oscillatoria sp. PMC 1076.18]
LLGLLPNYQFLLALPFATFLAVRIIPPFFQAAREPIPEKIRTAVMAGVLSLIVLDAAVAAGFTNLIYGFAVLILLPISLKLAKLFSVT